MRIQNWFQGWFGSRQELEGQNTTQSGSQSESPAYHETMQEQLRWDREAIIQDARNLVDEDPRAAQSNQEIARDVWGAGLRVTVQAADGTPDAIVDRAQDVIDAFMRDCDVNGHGPGMISGLLEDGDLFLSPIVRDTRVCRLQLLPTATMERLENSMGLFADVSQAFRQIDILTRDTVAVFPLWQVNHIRYNYLPTRGTPYGRSQYLQIRGRGRALGNTENDLVVRRRTRAPLQRHHKVGAEGSNSVEAVKAYKQLNGLDQPGASTKLITDYYSTGDVTITPLEGDANLGEIDDVRHLENVYMGRLGKPKGLMGGWGDEINRDVLEQQQEQYQEYLNGLRGLLWNGDGGVYSGLKALCDFALSLAGLNPQQITYQPSWPRKLTKSQTEFIVAMAGLKATTFVSHKTALGLVGPLLGIESVEAELLLIEEERRARQQAETDDDQVFAARQTGSRNGGAEDDDDDDEGTRTSPRRTAGQAATVQ